MIVRWLLHPVALIPAAFGRIDEDFPPPAARACSRFAIANEPMKTDLAEH